MPTFQPSAPPGPSNTVLDFASNITAQVLGYKAAKAQAKATQVAPANTPVSNEDKSQPSGVRWGMIAAVGGAVLLAVLLLRKKD